MKFNARSALILLLILALSVGFGFAYDGIATALERNKYPLNERYADTGQVGFVASKRLDGKLILPEAVKA